VLVTSVNRNKSYVVSVPALFAVQVPLEKDELGSAANRKLLKVTPGSTSGSESVKLRPEIWTSPLDPDPPLPLSEAVNVCEAAPAGVVNVNTRL